MGGRGGSSGLSKESPERGKPSTTGKLKTAIVYHGSYATFSEFDSAKIGNKNQINQYGEGFYFADTPQQARLYGDNVYEVEIKYSTDRRSAKKTGRTQDYQYSEKTGIWTIPYSKTKNIRIISRRNMS